MKINVPKTIAPEIAKTKSCCSEPGLAAMRVDGSGRSNTMPSEEGHRGGSEYNDLQL